MSVVSGAGNSIKNVGSSAGNSIKNTGLGAIGKITSVNMGGVGSFFSKIFSGMANFFGNIFGALSDIAACSFSCSMCIIVMCILMCLAPILMLIVSLISGSMSMFGKSGENINPVDTSQMPTVDINQMGLENPIDQVQALISPISQISPMTPSFDIADSGVE